MHVTPDTSHGDNLLCKR